MRVAGARCLAARRSGDPAINEAGEAPVHQQPGGRKRRLTYALFTPRVETSTGSGWRQGPVADLPASRRPCFSVLRTVSEALLVLAETAIRRSDVHTATHPPTPPISTAPVLTGLGQALRWLRERQARKQYQVASAASITKGMLSAYETGRQRPSLETLDKLLETLGCDLNDLHNALQIVNGRPEQMKGWRGGGPYAAPYAIGAAPSLDAKTTTAAMPAWPDEIGPGMPASGAYPTYGTHPANAGAGFPPLSEVHEPPRSRTIADLYQILGLLGDQQSPATAQAHLPPTAPLHSLPSLPSLPSRPQLPQLPPEEELALAQMLEGFHNLLRYWHRCLAALIAPGPANPPSPPGPAKPTDPPGPANPPSPPGPAKPTDPPDAKPPATGRSDKSTSGAPPRSRSR
jgi:transcriptional regulator with XRE-family HTH domain